MRGKGLKHLIADSAFKRMQVDHRGAYGLDADEHHLDLALRTGGALNCNERDDGRQGSIWAALNDVWLQIAATAFVMMYVVRAFL